MFFKKVRLIANNFLEQKCLLRASALSYSSLLSIVPLFAGVLLVMKAVGAGGEAEEMIQHLQDLISRIIPSGVVIAGEESLAKMLATKYYEFADKLSVGAIGGVGLSFLIISIISLFVTVEQSMNDIWGVTNIRSTVGKVAIFLIVLIIIPIFLMPALSSGLLAKSQYIINWVAGYVPFKWFAGVVRSFLPPFLFMTITLTLFYKILPNTKVKIRSSFIAALIASLLINLVIESFGYVISLTGKAKMFSLVYGALAMVPLLLMFVYISWVITLFGAVVAYVDQNAKTLLEQKKS